jgi:hypothetical protein
VLPTHDGFGTFPSSAGLQEQLWQFERYNPQRKKHVRRRSSVQRKLDAMAEEQDIDIEDERTVRIEKWRLDQSRAVLDEIEKETRRRKRRMSRMSSAGGSVDVRQGVLDDAALSRSIQIQESIIIEEPETESKSEEPPVSESFWQRITRRVIRDLIGLDENTLSVIFGESLPEAASPTPTQPSPIAMATASPTQSRVTFADPGYSWEVKLLDHIARELGVLLHQLTEHDGQAFSTYLSTQTETPDYAGLPVQDPLQRQPSLRQQRRLQTDHLLNATSTDPMFAPTISQPPLTPSDAPDTSLWGIGEEPDNNDDYLEQERTYWERDIDVNMIFTYLKRRFSQSTSPPSPTNSPSGPLPASWATTMPTSSAALGTSPESLRRAEVIRRQHPLVSRAAERAQSRRRESLLRRHQLQQIAQKRPGSSSCASQSTKRSRRSMSGSSRHYWDLGGSVGSEAAVSSGALGGWGEV